MTRLQWAVAAAGLMLIAVCQPMLQQLNSKFDPASVSYVSPAANIPTGFAVVSGSEAEFSATMQNQILKPLVNVSQE